MRHGLKFLRVTQLKSNLHSTKVSGCHDHNYVGKRNLFRRFYLLFYHLSNDKVMCIVKLRIWASYDYKSSKHEAFSTLYFCQAQLRLTISLELALF